MIYNLWTHETEFHPHGHQLQLITITGFKPKHRKKIVDGLISAKQDIRFESDKEIIALDHNIGVVSIVAEMYAPFRMCSSGRITKDNPEGNFWVNK